MNLMPHQRVAVDTAVFAFRSVRVALGVMPMQAGKTHTGLEIGRQLQARRVLIATPRKEIAQQWADTAENDFYAHAGVMHGECYQPFAEVVAGTMKTLGKEQSFDDILEHGEIDLFIFDEAHRASAATGKRLLEWVLEKTSAKVLLITATPRRGDGQSLDAYAEIDLGWHNRKELEKAGVLAKPDIIEYTLPDPDLLSPETMHYVWNAWGEETGTGRYGRHKQTVAFVNEVETAKRYAKYFNENSGPVATVVYGAMSKKDRERALEDYRSGFVQVLFNVFVVAEGVSFPNTECVMLIQVPGYETPYMQKSGRTAGGFFADRSIKERCKIMVFAAASHLPLNPKPGYVDFFRMAYNGLSPLKKRWYRFMEWLIEINQSMIP